MVLTKYSGEKGYTDHSRLERIRTAPHQGDNAQVFVWG